MCGIVGYIGCRRAAKILLPGLKKLEYRGYDSAGITVLKDDKFETYKCVGKLDALLDKIKNIKIYGTTGIAHTRWATHGKPTEPNAHPHFDNSREFTVAHNGIIENYQELKEELISKGYKFYSETDTEVIPNLINEYYNGNLEETVLNVLPKLEGSFAMVILSSKEPKKLVCARLNSPLILGEGNNENFIASDIPAILNHTKKVIFLDNNEIAVVTADNITVKDINGKVQSKAVTEIGWDALMAEKQDYKHFMLKEIFEQPKVIAETVNEKIENYEFNEHTFNLPENFIKNINKIHIVSCGTAFHAGLVGKYIFEELTELNIEGSFASEFRYRKIKFDKNDIILTVSQSGETADTLAAIRKGKEAGIKILSICNVQGSTIDRDSDFCIYTNAGPEIGVASTKAFTTQLSVIYLIALRFAKILGTITENEFKTNIDKLLEIPTLVEDVLEDNKVIVDLSHKFHKYKNFLYLGRHFNYPIALEGALKLKEISYVHAEAYPAGEMKHGPIALITEQMPVVIVATESVVFDKVKSNMEEVKARDGIIILVTNYNKSHIFKGIADYIIEVPETIEMLSPIINSVPLQLLAYHIANWLGCDIDQPRNLAKSVTVE